MGQKTKVTMFSQKYIYGKKKTETLESENEPESVM